MPIRIANQLDEEAWDQFVSRHPKASPYHRFAWKKSIENSYSHKCIYLLAEDELKNIIGVLPTALIKLPLTHGQLCSLPFCDHGEALATTLEVETALIEKAQEIAFKSHADYLYRASDDIESYNANEVDQNSGLKVRMLLDLPESSDILLSNFKSKLRSQIKKAEKNQLKYEIGCNNYLIDDFYQVYTSNMRNLGSPAHSKRWFEEIAKNYQDNMILSVIKHENQPIGAGLVLFSGDFAVIPWASTKREFNKLAPNMLLYWSLLKYATDEHYKFFDFGRSTYGEGTYKFKQQWGAYPIRIDWKTFGRKRQTVCTNTSSKQKSNFRILAESVWRHLPLPMTVLIGSSIRKYISL